MIIHLFFRVFSPLLLSSPSFLWRHKANFGDTLSPYLALSWLIYFPYNILIQTSGESGLQLDIITHKRKNVFYNIIAKQSIHYVWIRLIIILYSDWHSHSAVQHCVLCLCGRQDTLLQLHPAVGQVPPSGRSSQAQYSRRWTTLKVFFSISGKIYGIP